MEFLGAYNRGDGFPRMGISFQQFNGTVKTIDIGHFLVMSPCLRRAASQGNRMSAQKTS